MNNDNSNSVLDIILMWIVSIPVYVMEYFWPSHCKPKDFFPIGTPKYKDNCFYLTFPCYKFQKNKRRAVIDFWQQTCYVNHNDEFVFAEAILGQTFLSNLIICFRPKNSKDNITINIYDSNVYFNIKITEQRIGQINNLKSHINSLDDLDDKTKEEYISLLNDIIDNQKPPKNLLNKLFSFVMKNKEEIEIIANITDIISTLLSFII